MSSSHGYDNNDASAPAAAVAAGRSVDLSEDAAYNESVASNLRMYTAWFKEADADRDGRVGGKEAASFLQKSYLPRNVLGQIWTLSDTQQNGSLTFSQFCRALVLISKIQHGQIRISELSQQRDVDHDDDEADLAMPPPLLDGKNGVKAEDLDELCMRLGIVNLSQAHGGSTSIAAGSSPGMDNPDAKGGGSSSSILSDAGKKAKMSSKSVMSISDGLRRLYMKVIKPIEESCLFPNFHNPLLRDSDFGAKPLVMLLGQYSTGKTTFVKTLLDGMTYPQAQIGPEPTTDRFVAVSYGVDEQAIPGNTLCVDRTQPFTGLTKFGSSFLNKFAGATCPAKALEQMTIIDTPGVLSGDKQRIERRYDFPGVVRWFAERSDLILLMFDPFKLDISDEFRRVISACSGHDDKIRVILNKANSVSAQHLMRVYGALMWSLSRVLRSPEVPRVYCGNFSSAHDGGPGDEENGPLLQKEKEALLADLYDVPRRHVGRRVNEYIKRIRTLRIHALLVSALRDAMPSMMGVEKKRQNLIDNLEDVFLDVQRKYNLPVGDFPDIEVFRESLRGIKDFKKFPRASNSTLKAIDDVLEVEVPALLTRFGNPFQ